MNKYETFLKQRKLINSGMTSSVYFWNGYAYKCFIDNYPEDWIEYEYKTQKQIAKSKLNIAKYYRSEFKHTLKMDYIKGKSLASKFNENNKDLLLDSFINEFIKVHKVKNLDLENLSEFLKSQIEKAPVNTQQKNKAKKYIKEIEKQVKEDDTLCHMDYHFLNTMVSNKQIYIMDWVDARNGKAIYDYARTYVMIYEYAAGFKQGYLKRILAMNLYSKEVFEKAVYVNAINRLEECDDKRVRKLIELIETNKWRP